jgi:hypothetical protein
VRTFSTALIRLVRDTVAARVCGPVSASAVDIRQVSADVAPCSLPHHRLRPTGRWCYCLVHISGLRQYEMSRLRFVGDMTGPVAGMFKAWNWAESSLARLTSVLFSAPASACSQAFTPLRNPSSAYDVIEVRNGTSLGGSQALPTLPAPLGFGTWDWSDSRALAAGACKAVDDRSHYRETRTL